MKILTTHVGSLPRPHDLLDLMKAKVDRKAVRQGSLREPRKSGGRRMRAQAGRGRHRHRHRRRAVQARLLPLRARAPGGVRRRARACKRKFFAAEVAAFPEYYEQYFKQAMLGGTVAPVVPMVCTGPVKYRGEAALARDIANLKAAAAAANAQAVFMPAVAPSGVGANEYYKTEEEFFHAVGAALRTEYKAIVDAGFTAADRRSVPLRHLRRSGLDAKRARARRDVRRGAQREPARHPAGEGALPHLLRHQRGAAHPRGGARRRGRRTCWG